MMRALRRCFGFPSSGPNDVESGSLVRPFSSYGKLPISWFMCLTILVSLTLLITLISVILNSVTMNNFGALLINVNQKMASSPSSTGNESPASLIQAPDNHPVSIPPLVLPIPSPEPMTLPEPSMVNTSSPEINLEPPPATPSVQVNSISWIFASKPDYSSLDIIEVQKNNSLYNSLYIVNPFFMTVNPNFDNTNPLIYITSTRLNIGYIDILYNLTIISSSYRLLNNYIPFDITITKQGKLLFISTGQGSISNRTNKLLVLNVSQDGLELSLFKTLSFGNYLQRISLTPDDSQLYITDSAGTLLFLLNTESLTLIANIPVPFGVGLVKHLPDNDITIISGINNTTLSILDRSIFRIVGSITLPHGKLGNVVDLAYNTNGSILYVPNGISSLFIYNFSKNRIQPELIGDINSGGKTISCVKFFQNTLYLTLASDNSLVIIDSLTLLVKETISLGRVILNAIGPLYLLLY